MGPVPTKKQKKNTRKSPKKRAVSRTTANLTIVKVFTFEWFLLFCNTLVSLSQYSANLVTYMCLSTYCYSVYRSLVCQILRRDWRMILIIFIVIFFPCSFCRIWPNTNKSVFSRIVTNNFPQHGPKKSYLTHGDTDHSPTWSHQTFNIQGINSGDYRFIHITI